MQSSVGKGRHMKSSGPTVNSPSGGKGLVISVEEFRGKGGGRRSDFEAMRAALRTCRERKASTLVLPKGTYRFDDAAVSEQHSHIALEDLSDLTIDGQGSELLFHHIQMGVRLKNCRRVALRNFAIDWAVNLASPGVVERQRDGRKAIRIHPDYPLGGKQLARAVSEYDLAHFQWKMTGAEIYYPAETQLIGPQLIYSPSFEERREPPHGSGGLEDGMEVVTKTEIL